MPKTAHFIDSLDPGGAETMVIDICRSIGRYGYSPVVYHLGNDWLEKKCREFDIPIILAPGRRFFSSSKTIPIFFALFAKFLQEQRVDILHSHLFGAISGACIPARFAGTPHIGTLHDLYTLAEKKQRVRYLKLASLLGTQLVAVSRQIKSYLDSSGDFTNRPILTVENGVDLDKFNLIPSRKSYADLGITDEHMVFICVGRLETIKGHDVLLRAFGRIESRKPILLLIVGDGSLRDGLQRQMEKSGLQGKVRLLGHRDDIPQLLAISDCFVLSSRSEGLSCSIIEAMAAGLPIIATDVGGNSELVKNGFNGYLIPPENEKLLSQSMTSLLNQPSLAKEFGAWGRRKAMEAFSLEVTVNTYVRIYDAEMKQVRQTVNNRRCRAMGNHLKDFINPRRKKNDQA